MEKKLKKDIRPPVVTLMGHVDHGKTTLLDVIRKTNIVSQEHGGITQHIGAYQITFQDKPITFIDTPGHAAFEKMRFRGAEVADVVILVVAATEGVKPQTIEAIKHIKNTQKPIIVAITKTDLPNINIEKVKKELQKQEVVVESYGGEVPVVEVSAPKNKGISELLEMILLVWQMSPQYSLREEPFEAVVIESFLDKSRGIIASIIVKKGTLKIGQKIQMDGENITIRALVNDKGQNVKEAIPGQPVEVLGFKKLLEVGSLLKNFTNVQSQISEKHPVLADIIARTQEAQDKFKVIIKADVAGTLEAVLVNLPAKILVISSGIGEITLNDISFAKASQAPILAFNVKTAGSLKTQAEREKVVIRNYNVIYELISDMEDIVTSFEKVKQEQKITGKAKVIAVFDIDGQKIAGASITNGQIKVGDQIKVKSATGKEQEAKIISLKKFKKEVEKISAGQECGIGLSPSIDFKEGDIIESLG